MLPSLWNRTQQEGIIIYVHAQEEALQGRMLQEGMCRCGNHLLKQHLVPDDSMHPWILRFWCISKTFTSKICENWYRFLRLTDSMTDPANWPVFSSEQIYHKVRLNHLSALPYTAACCHDLRPALETASSSVELDLRFSLATPFSPCDDSYLTPPQYGRY
jgi:hypothetical protein